MGNRHQLFVIAKVNGKYRTLCVVHHQWLSGLLALRRCLDTLRIFGDASNRVPLEQELIAAARKDEQFWTRNDAKIYYERRCDDIAFPFVATCLVIGASFDRDGYYHHVSVQSMYMEYNKGDNNSGEFIPFSLERRSTSSVPEDFHKSLINNSDPVFSQSRHVS